MRDIQSARAAKNAVLHVGTNALFRRSCIMEINGYPTCSITEDMAVGMVLQAKRLSFAADQRRTCVRPVRIHPAAS